MPALTVLLGLLRDSACSWVCNRLSGTTHMV